MIPAPRTDDLEQHLYDFPSSPLFARLAERLLETGDVARALTLCTRGLEHYPEYSTGQIMLARCLAAGGDHGAAVVSIERAIGAYPGNIILEDLRSEWTARTAAGDGSRPSVSAGITPVPATGVAEIATIEPPADTRPVEAPGTALPGDMAVADMPVDTPVPLPAVEETPEPVDLPTVGPIVQEPVLEEVSVPVGTGPGTAQPAGVGGKSSRGFIAENRIVSRTLAEIYANQGALDEAVTTYRLLVAGSGENREMYEERLRELEEHLKLHPGPGTRPPE